MMPPTFRLLVITPVQTLVREQALVRDLFSAGLASLHLRKPGHRPAALKAYLKFFTAAERKKIVVHCADTSLLEEGIAGLHRPFSELRSGELPPGRISTSVHSWQEYEMLPPETVYTFIGPVYHSISKPGYRQNKHAWQLPRHLPVPAIALGGIHQGNAAALRHAGFSGAALLGSIWRCPEDAVRAFRAILQQSRQHV